MVALRASQADASAGSASLQSVLDNFRRASWISFWTQLALSLASAGVFVFNVTSTQRVRRNLGWSRSSRRLAMQQLCMV